MTESENHDTTTRNSPFRHYALATAKAIGAVLLMAFFVHASWNMFAPDMFGLEAIRMKQALGLVIFAGVFVVLCRLGVHKTRPSATV